MLLVTASLGAVSTASVAQASLCTFLKTRIVVKNSSVHDLHLAKENSYVLKGSRQRSLGAPDRLRSGGTATITAGTFWSSMLDVWMTYGIGKQDFVRLRIHLVQPVLVGDIDEYDLLTMAAERDITRAQSGRLELRTKTVRDDRCGVGLAVQVIDQQPA